MIMMTNAKRELKRMIRRAAPRMADRLALALSATRDAPEQNAARFGNLMAHIQEAQREFDAHTTADAADVAEVAANSSVVAVGVTPFDNVSLVVDELRKARLDVAEFVVVDATAEVPRLVAIRDHVAAWKRRLPLTRFKVVQYSLQDLRYADALEHGWREATRRYVWIAGRYDIPLDGCFTYLFETLVEQRQRAVIVTGAVSPDAGVRRFDVDPRPVAVHESAILDAEKGAGLLVSAINEIRTPDGKLVPDHAVDVFSEGIFGGPRELLADEVGQLLDTGLITNLSVTALSRRLNARGIPMVCSGAAFSRSLLGKLTDDGPPWEAIHDLRRIGRRGVASSQGEAELIDIVCPFHRGDMILAVQVAAYAALTGKKIRLHVAEPLVSWAKEFGADIDIESVPVPVAAAQDTYRVLLDSYQFVATRPDCVSRIARCHPCRSLSDTGRNLVEYMLEQVGLPLDTRLPNLAPSSTAEQRRVAHDLVEAFGGEVVFVHPLGGWHLKTLPPEIMAALAEETRRAGLKLIQIGAANDRRVEHTDGAILKDFMPSHWKEILALGRALICVDSWMAHFAAILDMPQVSLYGSTHPIHVSSKRWFRNQVSPCLTLGPAVNCSPCNSLTCIAYPDRDYCTGYTVDRLALRAFLAGQLAESAR
jgi:hypothetical protein